MGWRAVGGRSAQWTRTSLPHGRHQSCLKRARYSSPCWSVDAVQGQGKTYLRNECCTGPGCTLSKNANSLAASLEVHNGPVVVTTRGMRDHCGNCRIKSSNLSAGDVLGSKK